MSVIKIAAEAAWGRVSETRRSLEDARRIEAQAVAERRRVEAALEHAEQQWRELVSHQAGDRA
jgi:hypothetical protein